MPSSHAKPIIFAADDVVVTEHRGENQDSLVLVFATPSLDRGGNPLDRVTANLEPGSPWVLQYDGTVAPAETGRPIWTRAGAIKAGCLIAQSLHHRDVVDLHGLVNGVARDTKIALENLAQEIPLLVACDLGDPAMRTLGDLNETIFVAISTLDMVVASTSLALADLWYGRALVSAVQHSLSQFKMLIAGLRAQAESRVEPPVEAQTWFVAARCFYCRATTGTHLSEFCCRSTYR